MHIPLAFLALFALALTSWGLILWAMFLDVAHAEGDPGNSEAFHSAFQPKIRVGRVNRTCDRPSILLDAPGNGPSRHFRFVPPSSVTPGGVVKPAKVPAGAKS